MAGIVGNGEVPPVVSRALDTRVDEVESLLCKVRANHSTCPEYLYLRVELVAVDGERTVRTRFCPKLRVVGRADNERSNVALRLHELFCEAVYECHLLLRVSTLAVDVVEVDGERAHAEFVHEVELVYEVVIILLVPLDVLARVDSPHEVDAVAAASLHEFVDVLSLLRRVGQAPVRTAVIRVVLRSVHILVELVASVVVDER